MYVERTIAFIDNNSVYKVTQVLAHTINTSSAAAKPGCGEEIMSNVLHVLLILRFGKYVLKTTANITICVLSSLAIILEYYCTIVGSHGRARLYVLLRRGPQCD